MVVWKRKVLSLEEKTFAGTGKRRKKEEKKNSLNAVYLVC